ncbi:MAG: hypothetical protein JO182_22855 [Acidobacteriaceae bacterium]|nr:hypothetical protein [Acidobacteriaceae bacterium]MBV9222400.1 hypothetical protein [Acidobacteriaceae bacterium]MBV9308348.1 hypothetical protein [Acidobacteriaceae bacterium]
MAISTDYVEIDQAQVLECLIRGAGFHITEKKAALDTDAEKWSQETLTALRTLEQASINQPDGGLRVLVGDTHIKLRGSIWELVQLGLELTLEHEDPTGMFLALGKAVRGISDKITRIKDPIQLLVVKAIASVTSAKKRSGVILAVPEASVAEIHSNLVDKQSLPAVPTNLLEILASLAGQEIISEIYHEGRGPYYAVTF